MHSVEFKEREVVQKPLIEQAKSVGWQYLSAEEVSGLRSEDSPLLDEVFLRQIQKLNPGIIKNRTQAENLLRDIKNLPHSIEGNQKFWTYLRGSKTIYVQEEGRERNVCFIDWSDVNRNQFHVVEEFVFDNGRHRIRADVVFFINGIPVLIVEAKAPGREEAISEGLDQIRRYHDEAPEFLTPLQLFAVTNRFLYFYGPTWNVSSRSLYKWKWEKIGDFGQLLQTFLNRKQILQIIHDYILFIIKDGQLIKVILRPHQMRAVEKIVLRVLDTEKNRALIWHTQGSGKTFTMLTTARTLLQDSRLENPTILMIIDRNELQQQLIDNLEAAGFRQFYVAKSKKELRKLLREDTRGLIVSMIHKFDKADANLNQRSNIIVLIDEAHRTTGGDLGNYLMGSLPNATFIGFTGTPIDKSRRGKSTFQIFGIHDAPKGYLDKYSIKDSIEDGTTVPLHYQLAPNKLLVDVKTMEEEFFDLVEAEGIADVEELNRILDKAVKLKELLKNPERVDAIAKFVAEHFQKFIEPMGYKAFLVAVDREACAFYKEALDKYLPPEYSEVVISHGHNDPAHLKKYHMDDAREQEIRRKFKQPDENPKILIVTEKLLTGYDAPILYVMYLDKPMRDHVLLQAIARVNRPYEDGTGRKKTNGLIIDFVGIFNNLQKALAFDSEDIKEIVQDIQVLKDRFHELMEEAREQFLKEYRKAESPERKLELIMEKILLIDDRKDQFHRIFTELQKLYEILSPDEFLRPYLDDYKILVEIYRILRNYDEADKQSIDRELLRKTIQIVRENSGLEEMKLLRKVYEINVETLQEILDYSQNNKQVESEVVKIYNLIKQISSIVAQKGKESPFLIPIGDRVKSIKESYEKRHISTKEALEMLENMIKEAIQRQEEYEKSGLSPEGFAVFTWMLVQAGFDRDKSYSAAKEINDFIAKFSLWFQREDQKRALRGKLYGILKRLGVSEHSQLVSMASKIIELLEQIKNLSK